MQSQRPTTASDLRRFLFAFLAYSAAILASQWTTDSGGCCAADEPKAGDVTLTAGTWEDVEKLVAANKGKIVIVDIWSTSCLPCITEYPNLLTLQKTHGDKIVCVSFNVDYVGIKSKPAETYRPRVEKFLKEKESAITNFLCSVPSDSLFEQLKLTSIPAVCVFNREGKQARRFDDSLLTDGKDEAFTYAADINPYIKSLVDASK